MAMSEEEILREAARIRAGRRLRVAKTCARCGNAFVGIAQAKYCSDACRMAAARDRRQQQSEVQSDDQIVRIPAQLPGEAIRAYWVRTAQRPLTQEDEDLIAAMERIRARAQPFRNADGAIENSTDVIRRDREERAKRLAGL